MRMTRYVWLGIPSLMCAHENIIFYSINCVYQKKKSEPHLRWQGFQLAQKKFLIRGH